MPRNPKSVPDELINHCLAAFLEAGTLDLSLDQLAGGIGTSKRMLVHYFGGRENIEEQAMTLLERRLRLRFSPASFPRGVSPKTVIASLWQQTTDPQSRGLLLLLMDLSRRAWNGSERAQAFYREQQGLWTELLAHYLPSKSVVEDLLQLFQGAVFAYLISGDPAPGKRALMRLLSNQHPPRAPAKT